MYTLALLLSLFLVMALLEHFGYFGTTVRAILFWCYLLFGIGIVAYYVAVPLGKIFRLGKVISYQDAAKIIGRHFPDVQDKLLNLLQLQEQGESVHDDLLESAIAQKTLLLKPVPFLQAIDLKANTKYLKYVAVPTLVILLLMLVSPTMITGPSHRITHYKTQFERPAPFIFIVENQSLEVPQQEDYELRVAIEGATVPSEAFINIEGNIYRMR